MKVFIIGGTGLLGSEAAKELIRRGHEVCALALPPLPPGASLPPEMQIEYGNYLELSDDELLKHLRGCEGFLSAAGIDERVEGPAPIYELYRRYNIEPVRRLLRLAKEAGVRHAAICGSYFAYFARKWPELELEKDHPYIRSRLEQEEIALSFADEDFDVAVLQLPYIFGTQPGRKPVWVFLVRMLRGMRGVTFWPRGGTTMLTVRQIGESLAGALERNHGGHSYPIGYYNLSWREMLAKFHAHMGCPGKPIVTIPDWMFALTGRFLRRKQRRSGIDGGLDLAKLHKLQCAECFIDKSLGSEPLGVTPDDIDAAIGESVRLSVEILDHPEEKIVDMKGE